MTMSVTQEMFDKCCEITAESSKSLSSVCKEVGCTYGAMRWFIDNNAEATAKYARAKESQADFLAEEMLDIADDSSDDEMIIKTKNGSIVKENKEFVNRSRLKIDTRKWIAEHLKPKKWGQKIDITSDGEKIVTKIEIETLQKSTQNSDKTQIT